LRRRILKEAYESSILTKQRGAGEPSRLLVAFWANPSRVGHAQEYAVTGVGFHVGGVGHHSQVYNRGLTHAEQDRWCLAGPQARTRAL